MSTWLGQQQVVGVVVVVAAAAVAVVVFVAMRRTPRAYIHKTLRH